MTEVRHLTSREKVILLPYLHQVDLDNAVLHIGEMPFYADMVIDAIAITRGNDIYFEDSSLTFTTPEELALLAHELVHVAQYRLGMNWAIYLAEAARGYENSRFEIQANEVEDRFLRELKSGATSIPFSPSEPHQTPPQPQRPREPGPGPRQVEPTQASLQNQTGSTLLWFISGVVVVGAVSYAWMYEPR